jgi:hypothetical protein
MEKIFKSFMYWINGEEFQDSIRHTGRALGDANNTKDLMTTLKKRVDNIIGDLKSLLLQNLKNG